jgi:thymidylate synthase
MHQYKKLIERILAEGEQSGDRTGTGTRRIFGDILKFDCAESLPVVTLKYTHLSAVIHELLWFIKGSTNIKYLQDNNVKIWDEWATEEGEVGPMYGAQWRHAQGTYIDTAKGKIILDGEDQLKNAIGLIKNNPTSRRIIIDCWDTKQIPNDEYTPKENVAQGNMALAPCHMFMQFQVSNKGRLNMTMYQRSVDSFLGLPFNIASYAILLNMVAQITNLKPGVFTWMGGDIHIYNNHIKQIELMLTREPKEPPTLELNPKIKNIDDFQIEDIMINNYECHPSIKGEISV